jgi:histidine triad (HIT) family protein
MQGCLFCSIIQGKVPADKVHDDDLAIAFKDIRPQAPVHVLIIPRKHISTLNDLTPDDNLVVGHMFQVARELAERFGIDQQGYRALFNTNPGAGQSVYHIHMHVLGGRTFSWPPG